MEIYFPHEKTDTVKKYPKPGHCAGLVQISPGQFSPGPEKVGFGPILVQKLLGLDWTGGIIASNHRNKLRNRTTIAVLIAYHSYSI